MRKVGLISILILLVSCQEKQQVLIDQDAGKISIEMKLPSEEIVSENPVELCFYVRNQGDKVDFSADQLKIFAFPENLQRFYHLEVKEVEKGTAKVNFSFPKGGNYKVYVKFAKNFDKVFSVEVKGERERSSKVFPDSKLQKQVGNLIVAIKDEGAFLAGRSVVLKYKVVDALTKELVTDLQQDTAVSVIGANEKLNEFFYTEAFFPNKKAITQNDMKEIPESEKISFLAEIVFPKEGTYRLWTEFRHKEQLITVPFTVKVESDINSVNFSEVRIPDGAFKVLITDKGFKPEEISYRKGEPLTLAFVRFGNENCGNEIVFIETGIKVKNIPVGETITTEIPTNREGEIRFVCGRHKGRIKIEK